MQLLAEFTQSIAYRLFADFIDQLLKRGRQVCVQIVQRTVTVTHFKPPLVADHTLRLLPF